MTQASTTSIIGALARAGLVVSQSDTLPQFVEAISDDSRLTGRNSLFVAVRGTDRDGHDFLSAAERAGACCAIVDDASRTRLPSIVVSDTRKAAPIAAAAFFDHPARKLRLAAVTGTNGKTTTVGMLRHLLDEPGALAASIGTLGVLVGSAGEEMPGGHGLTTPGPVDLQRILRELVEHGVQTVAMETSSHALHQGRVDGLEFEAGVFTNLTRDHLDYHVTMEAYFAAKALLISLLKSNGAAVLNADDDAWDALPSASHTIRFGLHGDANIRAASIDYRATGTAFTLCIDAEEHEVHLPLTGDFNISNALGAAGAARAMGIPAADIATRLASLPQVPGRLEMISERPPVLRDYAHTPDALARALSAVRPFTKGSLIVVFGCGGDRDKGKRAEMGRVAEEGADSVIVTSDNPRTEDPEAIIADIEAGMRRPHERVTERREAIALALESAGADDVILLAGKGHETYQIRGDVKYPFDERAIVQELLLERASG